jgi:serine protease
MQRLLALALMGFLVLAPTVAAERSPEPRSLIEPADMPPRLIVKFRANSELVRLRALSGVRDSSAASAILQERARSLGARTGLTLDAGSAVSDRVQALIVRGSTPSEASRRIAADPDVEWVEVDQRMRAVRVPNDPLYLRGDSRGPSAGQWALRKPDLQIPAAIDAEGAWSVTRGGAGVVVAVLDTGAVMTHVDLTSQWVAGYDLVSDVAVGNDGDARDSDPSDPGDWVTAAEASTATFSGCAVASSSWHGTQVAGIVAATTDNAIGVAGVGWDTRVMPVRVLGKCYGLTSDIAAGIRWAAGLSVAGTPDATRRADVVNLSLGGGGACSRTFQEAIDEAIAAGVVVVAAAGNSAGQAVGSPANCSGVIAVAAVRHVGTKVGYSDIGPEITVAAPGGNCVNAANGDPCLYPIITTTDSGSQGPARSSSYTDAYDITVGTSFAAPLVSGVAALIRSVMPGVSPAEVRTLLQSTTREFPTAGGSAGITACRAPDRREQLECYCTRATCGTGLLDARAALAGAGVPRADITVSPAVASAGEPVVLSASGSAAAPQRSIMAYRWFLEDGGGILAGLDDAAARSSTLTVVPTGPGRFVVGLEVTDSVGLKAWTTAQVDVQGPGTSTVDDSATGSGGGALGAGWVVLLGLACAAVRRARTPHSRAAPGATPTRCLGP